MLAISIQSQVVWGHVGNSAAVFPLQAAGVEVAAVPTVLLSNHPHYPTLRGRALDPALVADLLRGVEERGLAARADWLITGYMGAAGTAEAAAAFARRAKAANPGLTYLCDPVMGDMDTGFFVPEPVRAAVIGALAPLADVLTPNQFELQALTGAPVADVAACVAAARGLAVGLTLVTGAIFDNQDRVATLAVARDAAWIVETPRVDRRPGGTGDLFAALFVAARGKGLAPPQAMAQAVSGVHLCLRRTPAGDWPEMPLVACGPAFAAPDPLFPVRPIPEI